MLHQFPLKKAAKSVAVFILLFGAFQTRTGFSETTQRQLAEPKTWTIDKAHSSVSFEVTHFFTPVKGRFNDIKGAIMFDPADMKTATAQITIPISGIDTKNSRRDDHLRSPEFFDEAAYPEITFESSGVQSGGETGYTMTGDLTIRGITKTIEIPFTLLGVRRVRKGRRKRQIAGLKLQITLKRSDFNLGTGEWATDTVVGENVDVEIVLELE